MSGATLASCGENECNLTIRNEGLPNGVVGLEYNEDLHFDKDCR